MLLVRVVKATRSLVFTKFLKLPLKRSQEFSTGGVMNYMLLDAERMSKIFTILPQLIQLPIMMVVSVYMVYQAIGFAFLGVAITIVLMTMAMSYFTKQNNK
jgi:ABC-type transport system involved in cytochrome bd biosynthesis fused ATPase/permease subunit